MSRKDDELKRRFIEYYSKVTSTAPVPWQLAMGRDNKFYWIYYAGLGNYSFVPVLSEHLRALKLLLASGEIIETGEVAILPVYIEDNAKTAVFKLYELNKVTG